MIPLPYQIAGVLFIAIVAFFIGRENGLSKYYDFKSAVEAQQAQLQADADKARLESERITKQVSDDYAAVVDWLNRHPRTVRVQSNCDQGQVRSVPDGSSGLDGRPAQQGLGRSDITISVSECEARVNNAIKDASQLMALQRWVKQQSEVQR